MTHVRIRQGNNANAIELTIDGVSVGNWCTALSLRADAHSPIPTLILELLPRSLDIELPDVLTRLRDAQLRVELQPSDDDGAGPLRDEILERLASDLMPIAVRSAAEQYAELPKQVQLELLGALKLATRDEITHALNDDSLRAMLAAESVAKASADGKLSEMLKSITSIARTVEEARAARIAMLNPRTNLVIYPTGECVPYAEWDKDNSSSVTVPTHSEGDET